MKELLEQIKANFPQHEITEACFFHRDKDGKLTHCSPMFHTPETTQADGSVIKSLVQKMYEGAEAMKTMANDMIAKTLPHN